MSETLYFIGDIAMLIAILGALTFTISYAMFFNWRRTAAGRALMYFVGALDLWAIQSFVSRIDPTYSGREWARLFIYVAVTLAMWHMVRVLWKSWGKSLQIDSKRQKP